MPKKHQQRALLTKPPSSTPPALSLSKAAPSSHHGSSGRTVNDLIRESRRLQLQSEPRAPPVSHAASVPPSLRAFLDLPPPPPPAPLLPSHATGPSRLRRIPGPPPPQSWLTASIHAPAASRSDEFVDDGNVRVQVRTSNLPEGAFPPSSSLQHLVLKRIAANWGWHAEYDLDYLPWLPTNLKETLLSYLAVYNEAALNPLRLLFLTGQVDDLDQVRRLDLSNGLGLWTSLRQLEKDLGPKSTSSTHGDAQTQVDPSPDSWDAEDDEHAESSGIGPNLGKVSTFANLRHLSLAISPSHTRAASWSSLLSLASELQTLTSLSLAYWPQPTFTPNAASTRAVVRSPGSAPTVYGGTDMYAAMDDNWREAAGILRTLSKSLYCLKWLDLTGCGDWFGALRWTPNSPCAGSPSSDPLGPEWNGGWRGLERLILQVGWKPLAPVLDETCTDQDESAWDVQNERRLYRFRKDERRYAEIRELAESVAQHLRSVRKEGGGKWIDVDVGEALVS